MLLERKKADPEGSFESAKRLSLRDPAGNLYEIDGRLFRVLKQTTSDCFAEIQSSFGTKKLIQESKLIDSRRLSPAETSSVLKSLSEAGISPSYTVGSIYEHRKLDFVSYPHEWCREMLRDAGLLTIEIAEELLKYNLGLKDGTPFNILFDSYKPIFVDALSLEQRSPRDPMWLAYGQFCKTFVNTFMLSRSFKTPFEPNFYFHRDGMPIKKVYSLLSLQQKMLPPFLGSVTLPALFSRIHKPTNLDIYQPKQVSEEAARFILQNLFKRLRKSLTSGKAQETNKISQKYMQIDLPYSQEEFSEKSQIVESILRSHNDPRVLDVGCNTGHFSKLAAMNGKSVVAIDSDSDVIDALYLNAKREKLNILPVFMDITNPTPATGWESSETSSFLARAHGKFDTVLMLAVVHHLMTTHAIPLEAIASLAAKLTKKWLVIEYISPEDPVFTQLAHGRDYSMMNKEFFEATFGKLFTIEQTFPLKNQSRTLYLLKKSSYVR